MQGQDCGQKGNGKCGRPRTWAGVKGCGKGNSELDPVVAIDSGRGRVDQKILFMHTNFLNTPTLLPMSTSNFEYSHIGKL